MGGLRQKLQNGLDKISFAEGEVSTLKAQIIEMNPVLKKTSEEVAAMIVQIDKDKVGGCIPDRWFCVREEG